jgi:putative transcriptional regulator
MTAKGLKVLGNKIRQLRETRGFNQREFARKARVDTALLSRLEAGIGNPGYNTLSLIAKGLEISLSELLEGTE